jgi:hypothetical protein
LEYVEKALEMGISFNRGSDLGTWRRARMPGTLREGYVEKALEMAISSKRGSNWGTWRRARIPGL